MYSVQSDNSIDTQWLNRCKMIRSIISETITEQNLQSYSDAIYYTLNEYIKSVYFENRKIRGEEEMGQLILMQMHKYIADIKNSVVNTDKNEKKIEKFPSTINDSIEILQKQRMDDVQQQYENKKLQLQTEFVPDIPKQIDFSDTNIKSYTEDTGTLLQNEIESRKQNIPIPAQDTLFPVEYIWVSTKSVEWNKNICVIELSLPDFYNVFTITNIFFQHGSQSTVSDYVKIKTETEENHSWFFRNREILQYQGYLHVRNKQSKIQLYFEEKFDFKNAEIQIMVFN